MSRITLHSDEISCDGCIRSIRIQLEEVEGVRAVVGDPDKQEITVEFEPPATADQLKAAMDEAGYPVK